MPRVKSVPKKRSARSAIPRTLALGRRVAFLGRRMYNPRSKRVASQEFASLKEIVETQIIAGTVNDFSAFGLADLALERAPSVAGNYQYFKITRIDCRLLVNTDTYPAGGGFGMPQVYWLINRGQSIPAAITFDEFKDAGARPRLLNEANLRWSFRPAVLNANRNLTGGLVSLYPKISPWLDTNANAGTAVPWAPSTTEHGGFLMGITKMNAGDATAYNVQFTYHFKFMKPLVKLESSPSHYKYKDGKVLEVTQPIVTEAAQQSPPGA